MVALKRAALDLFVLDGLANDIEDLEHLLGLLNYESIGWKKEHGGAFERPEVVTALVRLIKDDLVEACVWSEEQRALTDAGQRVLPEGSWDDVWFRMTARGRLLHQAWCAEDEEQ